MQSDQNLIKYFLSWVVCTLRGTSDMSHYLSFPQLCKLGVCVCVCVKKGITLSQGSVNGIPRALIGWWKEQYFVSMGYSWVDHSYSEAQLHNHALNSIMCSLGSLKRIQYHHKFHVVLPNSDDDDGKSEVAVFLFLFLF